MAKRTASAAQIQSRRTKRPRNLDDPPPRPCSSAQIQSLDDPSRPCSSLQIQSERSKRKSRRALLACSTSESTSTTPSRGAKRARAALSVPPALSGSPLSRPKCWRDWSNLDGPAGLIAERVLAHDVADYVRFRSVCRAWRRSATDPRELGALDDGRFHPRRWLMLRQRLSAAAPHRRRFVDVTTGQCVQMDLPELRGHSVFGPTAEGLLVLVHEHTLVARLLNPFTRQLAELPSLATLLPRERLEKCLSSTARLRTCYAHDLAVRGAGLAGERTVALYFSEAAKKLAVAKPGDERWTVVDRGTWFKSALSFRGQFYCVADGKIKVVKATEGQPPRLVAAAKLTRPHSAISETVHLVENGGELMLVHRSISARCDDRSNKKYDVYRVDFDARKTVPAGGLDGHAVFVGMFRAVSVCTKLFPCLSADAIYPGFELYEKVNGDKIDAYHLADGSTEPSTCSYDDMSGGIRLARPYRIADLLSMGINGYRDISDELKSSTLCCNCIITHK